MLNSCFFVVLTFFLQALSVEAGDYCQYGYTFSSYYYSTYCDYGCCGNKDSSYSSVCCTQNVAGIIAGAVIGSLVGLAILIGITVFCCVQASYSNRRTGVVVQTANPTIQTLVVTQAQANSGPYGTAGYGYPGVAGTAPPQYTPYNNMPSGSATPAYPPPPAKY